MRLILRTLSEAGKLGEVFSWWDSDSDRKLLEWQAAVDRRVHAAEGSRWQLAGRCLARCSSDQILVVGHLGLAPLAMALKLAGRIRGYVVILHGVEAWRELKTRNAIATRFADGLVATTPFTRDAFARTNHVHPTRIAILPLALDKRRFQHPPSAPTSRQKSAPLRILSVARLDASEQYKGVDHTVSAMARLRARGVDASYRVVGYGDDSDRLEALARRQGVDDDVDFLGRVSDETLREEFRRADVFCLPSSGEGFGLVYLEAMHYALPCVACAEGGAQYVVGDDHDGLHVPYADPDGLADALERLVDDPRLYARLSRNAVDSLASKFSFERFSSDFLSIVERLPCAE